MYYYSVKECGEKLVQVKHYSSSSSKFFKSFVGSVGDIYLECEDGWFENQSNKFRVNIKEIEDYEEYWKPHTTSYDNHAEFYNSDSVSEDEKTPLAQRFLSSGDFEFCNHESFEIKPFHGSFFKVCLDCKRIIL